MSEAPERVLIDGGRRDGRSLQHEPRFRQALEAGSRVFTGPRQGVWFEVTLADDALVYTALTGRPEGV